MQVHDERCRKEIAAQGGLPRFVQGMVDEGLADEQVQQGPPLHSVDCCRMARCCIQAASSADSNEYSTESESGF
jgi:hypothetical protein